MILHWICAITSMHQAHFWQPSSRHCLCCQTCTGEFCQTMKEESWNLILFSFSFAHFAGPSAHRAGTLARCRSEAMCLFIHRYHPKAGIGFTILHFPSYLIVVSKDAFHCVYLAVVRAYLLKSACSNSVKFWRTKSRICLSVNFLPNSISFTLPSRFSWSQGFPRGIALGSSLNHTKVRDDFGPVTALAGEGDRDLSLAELDSAIVTK